MTRKRLQNMMTMVAEPRQCVQLEINWHVGKIRNGEEKLEETLIYVVDRVMKVQESSDAHFTELEEKRKFEKRLMEMEERQRREDRESQMRMLMVMQCMYAASPRVSLGSAVPPTLSVTQSGSRHYSAPAPTVYGYPHHICTTRQAMNCNS